MMTMATHRTKRMDGHIADQLLGRPSEEETLTVESEAIEKPMNEKREPLHGTPSTSANFIQVFRFRK